MKLFEISDQIDSLLCKTEAEILAGLSHPNIIQYIGFKEKVDINMPEQEYRNLSALMMEYAPGGELFHVAQALGPFSETIVRTYFSQVLSAVEYLHSNGIAHMDLKLENLLLRGDDTLKIADFGSAIRVSEGQKCEGVAGTLRFQPPEALEGKLYSPFSTDVFAIGIMIFTLVVGSMPFGKAERSDPFYGLIYVGDTQGFWSLHKQHCTESGGVWRNPSKEFQDLFYKLVNPDPSKRITLKELLKEKWISRDIVDPESLRVWMSTKRRIKSKGKTAGLL